MTARDDCISNFTMRSVRQINQCYKATPEIIRKYLRFHWRKQVVHLDDCSLTYRIEKALDQAVCVGYLDTEDGKYWVKGTCGVPDCPEPCPPARGPSKPVVCPPVKPPCKPPCPKPCPPKMCCPPPCPPCPPPCPAPPPCPPKCPPPCPPKPCCPPPPCPPKPRCGPMPTKCDTLNLSRYLPVSSAVLQKKVRMLEEHRLSKQLKARMAKAKNVEQREKFEERRVHQVWV